MKKVLRLRVSVILFLTLAAILRPMDRVSGAADESYALPDHLLPSDFQLLGGRYIAVVKESLCLTDFNVGRVLILPSFSGEKSISVYTRKDGGSERYFVTSISASESLSDRTQSGHYPRGAKSVQLIRKDAPLRAEAGEVLSALWPRLLETTRPLARHERAPELEFTDAPSVLFEHPSREGNTSGRTLLLPGKLPRRMDAAVRIVNLLNDYCEAGSAARSKIVRAIESQGAQLLRSLNGARQ